MEVGIERSSDLGKAYEVLLRVAGENELVLDDLAPIATFDGFGDGTLRLTLCSYLGDFAIRLQEIHELLSALNKAFGHEGIKAGFPQLDLHVKSPGSPVDTDSPWRVG